VNDKNQHMTFGKRRKRKLEVVAPVADSTEELETKGEENTANLNGEARKKAVPPPS